MTRQTKAYVALAFICIVWGTTYLAIRVGVMHYPPFLFAGIRQFIAGTVLMGAALVADKRKDLSRENILRQMLVGFLMLTVGNGGVTWGEKYIPSGIAALICSMMPLFAVLFQLLLSRKERFNATIGFGLLFGTIGVALIFQQNLKDMGNLAYLGGMLATLLATCSWALGSMVNKKNVKPVNPFFNSGMQLFFGGVFMLLISPAADSYAGLVWWNTQGLISLVYLIVFGSVLAYAAYMFALSALPMGIATIYAYINPMVAVLAGYLFLHERLDIYTGLAFVSIAISVFLMNRGYRQPIKNEPLTTIAPIAAVPPEAARLDPSSK